MTKIGLAREARADKAWDHQKRQPLAPWLLLHHLGSRKVSPTLLPSVSLLEAQLLRNLKFPWSACSSGPRATRTLAQDHSALFPPSVRPAGAIWDVRGEPELLPREHGDTPSLPATIVLPT